MECVLRHAWHPEGGKEEYKIFPDPPLHLVSSCIQFFCFILLQMGKSDMDGKESHLKKNKINRKIFFLQCLEISLSSFKTSDINCSGQLQEWQGNMTANAEDQSLLQEQSFLKNIN